jgi:hypothetical protein
MKKTNMTPHFFLKFFNGGQQNFLGVSKFWIFFQEYLSFLGNKNFEKDETYFIKGNLLGMLAKFNPILKKIWVWGKKKLMLCLKSIKAMKWILPISWLNNVILWTPCPVHWCFLGGTLCIYTKKRPN